MKKLILALLLFVSPLAANDVKDAAKEGVSAVKAKVAVAKEKSAQAIDKAADAIRNETTQVLEPMAALKESRFKNMHNKIVHFPIALGIFGALFLLLSFRYPSYKWPARALLFFAAAGATAALFTGEAQEAAFDGTSLTEILEWHERAGQVTTGLLWGALLLSFFEITRKFFWLYAIILFWFLITGAGWGGILAAA